MSSQLQAGLALPDCIWPLVSPGWAQGAYVNVVKESHGALQRAAVRHEPSSC